MDKKELDIKKENIETLLTNVATNLIARFPDDFPYVGKDANDKPYYLYATPVPMLSVDPAAMKILIPAMPFEDLKRVVLEYGNAEDVEKINNTSEEQYITACNLATFLSPFYEVDFSKKVFEVDLTNSD